jgi:hypothetical protein
MTRNAKLLGLTVTAALFTAAPLSPYYSPAKVLSVSLDRAEARVGRPLTPMSVAGGSGGSCGLRSVRLPQGLRIRS